MSGSRSLADVEKYVDSVLAEPEQGRQKERLLSFCHGRSQSAKMAWRQSRHLFIIILVIFSLVCLLCVLVMVAMKREQMEARQRAGGISQAAILTERQARWELQQAQDKARQVSRDYAKCQTDLKWHESRFSELERINRSLTQRCAGLSLPAPKGER